MKKFIVVLWVILLFSFAANAALDVKSGEERYILTRSSPVRISVETGWQRDGLIPIQIDIQGLNISLWMDGEGRVFDDSRLESAGEVKNRAIRQELFHLDKNNGQLQAGGQTLSGQIYEQNGLRTRLRLDNLALVLELDIPKGLAALDLAGIVIPVRVRLGKEAGGVQELEIGERGHRGAGRLLLDASQGRLFFEDNHTHPAADNRPSAKMCWAETQK